MKRIILIIILNFFFQMNVFGQGFVKSKKITLSKAITPSPQDNKEKDVYKAIVFLENSNNKIKFIINTDTFSEEYSYVEEIEKPYLKNVKKIVKVNIEHCACYCNADVYYWLVMSNNKWIELPKIEKNDYEIGNLYHEYSFKEEDKIELLEFREKMGDKRDENTPSGFEIERIYEKKIKDFIWNGKEVE